MATPYHVLQNNFANAVLANADVLNRLETEWVNAVEETFGNDGDFCHTHSLDIHGPGSCVMEFFSSFDKCVASVMLGFLDKATRIVRADGFLTKLEQQQECLADARWMSALEKHLLSIPAYAAQVERARAIEAA